MSDVDLIISVHTTGVKDVANLSASVRNLALNLKGVTVPMRSLDSHAKAVNKALGITSKGVQQHANSLKQLKANQAALSEESKRLRSNIQNYNLAILKAGGPTTKLGKELTYTQNQLKSFSSTLRGLRIRALGSDLANISLRLQKMGKDAQFVGRSLMINLTAPLLLFARSGLQNLVKVDAALVRLTKVLEGVAMNAQQADNKLGKGLAGPERQAAVERMINSFKSLDSALTGLSNKFGVSKDLVVGLATDFAELGISANENITALTELTLVTEKLGNMDASGAQDLSQALYFNSVRALEASGAFKTLTDARDREARAIASAKTQLNMFNSIENVTALTLRDLADSLPEVGGMAVSFGLSMTEAAALLAPMKAAGLDVGASANSIKVSLQRAISPTKQNSELLAKLAKQYGVASDTQNIFNQTTKTGLTGLQAIVDVFDKVESSSAGAEGALKLMSEIFEKRQGPRMYIAIQQMAQFNKELNKATRSASTSEGILASVAEGALGKFNQLNRTSLPATVNNFRDIGIIARIATAQAGQMVEGYGKVSAAEIKTAKEVRKAVADVVLQKKQNEGIDIIGTAKTESARAMLVELAGASNAQQVADMELEQSLGSLEVAIQKIKNSFKLFAADLMKTIGPTLKSMADKIQAFYEKWQSLSETTRQNISKVILGFLAFLAVLGPVVLGIGTIQASMGVLGRALTTLVPKLKNVDGGFAGLGISADFAKKKINSLYGTIVKSSLTKRLSFSGDLAEAQATAQAAMGTFAAPKAAKAPVLSSLLSPVNKGKITQSEQLKEFLARNVGATKSDFLKSRTISNKIAAGKALTPAQYTYQLTNAGKVASIPGAVAAGRATAATKIAGINTNIASANAAKTARAARQNLINARNPFYQSAGIATDRMGTRFFRAGEELLDDTTPATPGRTRGALSRLTGGRISATRRLLGTAEDQANILAGGGLQGARMQTQLRARKAVGSIKDFATTSKPANLGKGFVEALRPIKQYRAGVAGAQAAVTALQAKNATLGLAAPGTFAKMGTAIKGFVKNVKLADLAMKIFRMTMLATGIGAIILGIGVAAMLVVKNFGMFKEKAAGPLRGLAYAFGIIKKALLEITRPIQDMFAQFSNGESGVEGSVSGIVNIFKKLVGVVLIVAKGFRYLVNTIIKPYMYGVVNVVMAVVSMFKGNWGDAFKYLTAALGRVAEVFVSIFVMIAKVVIKIAAGIAKGVVKLIFEGVNGLIQLILLAIRGLINLVGKIPFLKGAMDSANNAIKNFGSTVSGAMDAAAGGVNSVIDGIAGGIESGYDAVGNLIKKGLKKGTDLGVKESKHSLQSGKKKIVDTGEEIGEETGEAIANATGDGFEENDPSGKIGEKLKDGIKGAVQELQDYIAGELKNAISKYVDQSTKALEKQRDAALKIYDTQIKTLGKLEKAEESLTRTKEYESNKRRLMDEKALTDEQFRRNFALAVYEGRTDDARMLQLEQIAQTKTFNEDLNSIESGRAKDLAKENLEALRDAINEAKDAAQTFFDEAIVKFQESVETITKFPPVTIEDYKTQIGQLYEITNNTATANAETFDGMFEKFATTINQKMPNQVIGAFTSNLDALVEEAKNKYGLGAESGENTIIGVTIGMLAGIGGVFGEKKQSVIDAFGTVTTGIKDNFKSASVAIINSINKDFLDPFSEATVKFRDNWKTIYEQAIIDGNKAITDSLRNNVEVNKDLFEEMRGHLSDTTLKWLQLKAAAEAAGEAQKEAAAGGGGGGDGTIGATSGAGINAGRADAYVTNNAIRASRGLAPISYQQFVNGVGLTTAAVAARPVTPAFIPNVPTNTFRPPTRKKGGIIPERNRSQNSGYPEGFIPAPTQEGVPALLHGGEYILNAKAVQRIGVGALNKMNNNLIPRFLKGGVVPGGKKGIASNTRGSADRVEQQANAKINDAKKQLALATAGVAITNKAKQSAINSSPLRKAQQEKVNAGYVAPKYDWTNMTKFGMGGLTIGAEILGSYLGGPIGGAIATAAAYNLTNRLGNYLASTGAAPGFKGDTSLKGAATMGGFALGGALVGSALGKGLQAVSSLVGRKAINQATSAALEETIQSAVPKPSMALELYRGPLQAQTVAREAFQEGEKIINESFQMYKIGTENVGFGIPAVNGGWDTVLNFKNVNLNPYDISGLSEFSASGQQMAKKWAMAHAGFTPSAGEAATYIDALLYSGMRGDIQSMLKFNQFVQQGIDATNAARSTNFYRTPIEDLQRSVQRGGLGSLNLDDLFLVHETSFKPPLDKFGNISLKPTGDYQSIFNDQFGRTEYIRDTIHMAVNHLVTGHAQRESLATGHVIVSKLKDVLDANPGALDNLYTVDTWFTPKPGQGLTIPKGSFETFTTGSNAAGQVRAAMAKLADVNFLPIENTFKGGAHGSETEGADALLRIFGRDLNTGFGTHFDTPAYRLSQMDNLRAGKYGVSDIFSPHNLSTLSDNAIARLAARKNLLSGVQRKSEYISKGFTAFKTGGYVPGAPSMAIPAILHGGEYVVNADAVRNMGVRTMQSINQSKFRAPSGVPSYAGGGGSTNVSTVNINVETFIGEEEWFKSMMNSYNVNVLPKQQKASGTQSRVIRSYNGINQGY